MYWEKYIVQIVTEIIGEKKSEQNNIPPEKKTYREIERYTY